MEATDDEGQQRLQKELYLTVANLLMSSKYLRWSHPGRRVVGRWTAECRIQCLSVLL